MQDVPAPYGGESPLFSIIIPLEHHRGQWQLSWLGWTSQTADKSLYEIILVVPPDFEALNELKALAGGKARLEFTNSDHDIGLCAFGAAKARGKYLFFTESHCRPEPDVMEACIRAIDARPDWAGFSCQSVPICHNRLSVAEAAMYQADIEFGMKQHPWRKVLDQCFVTRRDVYWECGGLREELGHFAEWVLAAAYHARGHTIGYLEEARFHHYYIGEIGELKTFTLDFVQGEIRYLSEARDDPGSELLETPIEWSSRGDFNVALARSALAARMRAGRVTSEGLQAIGRWCAIALAGDRLALGLARLAAGYARCSLTLLTMGGSRGSIARWLKRYIAALIHYQRLYCIRGIRGSLGGAAQSLGDQMVAQAGFHAWEVWQGRSFRWSEPEAALRIEAPPGRTIIRIASPEIRGPLDRIGVQFYLDGVRVADAATAIDADAFVLQLDLPPSGGAMLAWACPRFAAIDDPRRLGLPVAGIDVSAGEDVSCTSPPVAAMRG
ncbi:glycosyltransferase family 2 protein [Bradyrhizobium sp. S3.9.1]|uniref:glycosyltransferase family 2 protein n=1 Tax=Bradyrhizobium sp. S3.9.1 TaxID=3156431 RepID=UPI00339A1701